MQLTRWKNGFRNIFPPTIPPSVKRYSHILKNSFLDLLYPRICLHCKTLLQANLLHFCECCFGEINFSTPNEHCRTCYALLDETSSLKCSYCLEKPSGFTRALATFSPTPSATTLQIQLQALPTSFLAEGCAAFMALQLLKQRIPKQHYLIPCPRPWFTEYYQGFSPAALLSTSLSQLLGVEVLEALEIKQDKFTLKQKALPKLEDRRILLITDLSLPSSQLNDAAHALAEGFPQSITVLAFSSSRV